MGWPLDRIIHAEVWATDTIPADLPPMVEFKKKADKIILDRWGIEVEHVCATTIYKKSEGINTYEKGFYYEMTETSKFAGTIKGFPMQRGPWCNKLKTEAIKQAEKKTYEDCFYRIFGKKSKKAGEIYGFPCKKGTWCTGELKGHVLDSVKRNCISYIGIAADEPNRFHNLTENKKSPLVEAGWTESDCRKWCEENDLLSPIYKNACRGGCWFCHNQGVDQLRQLRHNYPDLWALLLKWDSDSPVTFHADGHTVHDFDKRFQLEDEGFIKKEERFLWSMVEAPLNYRLF